MNEFNELFFIKINIFLQISTDYNFIPKLLSNFYLVIINIVVCKNCHCKKSTSFFSNCVNSRERSVLIAGSYDSYGFLCLPCLVRDAGYKIKYIA